MTLQAPLLIVNTRRPITVHLTIDGVPQAPVQLLAGDQFTLDADQWADDIRFSITTDGSGFNFRTEDAPAQVAG